MKSSLNVAEVRFVDGRSSQNFYYDDVLGRKESSRGVAPTALAGSPVAQCGAWSIRSLDELGETMPHEGGATLARFAENVEASTSRRSFHGDAIAVGRASSRRCRDLIGMPRAGHNNIDGVGKRIDVA